MPSVPPPPVTAETYSSEQVYSYDNGYPVAPSAPKKPIRDSSSISWAFHDSVDSTGLLRWLSENVDASKNGLTNDELELLTYLDRIDYWINNNNLISGEDEDNTAKDTKPAFELKHDEERAKTRVARLDSYVNTIRAQGAVLANRADRVSVELAELQEEEERLKRAVKASDAEVARLTASYTGLLDETALSAKSMMARLCAEPPAMKSSYFYQSAEGIDGLCTGIKGFLRRLHERLGEHLEMADALPSPWSEFQPFSTQSVSGLLQLAGVEHERLGVGASEMVAAQLGLGIESELVRATDEEVERMQGEEHASLLQRFENLASGSTGAGDFGEYVGARVGEHAARLAAQALEKSASVVLVPSETSSKLAQLSACSKELADMQSDRLARVLDSALQELKPKERALVTVLHSLVAEREMLNGWSKLWTTVAASLDRDNAALEAREIALRKHASTDSSSSVIPPDDLLALSLKRLLGIYSQVGQSLLAGNTDLSGTLLECADSTDEDQRARLVAGAFTGWDALLEDAKLHNELCCGVQKAVLSRTKMAAGIERQ
ncbi:hypothetical protein IWW50_003747, partial [Coemansia erecta]